MRYRYRLSVYKLRTGTGRSFISVTFKDGAGFKKSVHCGIHPALLPETVFSSETIQLETKLYQGPLHGGSYFLQAKFAHGLNESTIWSINVLAEDNGKNFIPISYAASLPPALSILSTPDVVGTRFFLYSRSNRNVQIEIKRGSLKLWDPSKRTKFVIHGMIENYNATWYEDLRNVWLDVEDCNLIFVDWSNTNKFPYTKATANTQIVGTEVALLVNYIIEQHDIKAKDIHIVGHSLGAHAAGTAGSKIAGLGRITGLDPAGPYFENTDPRVRLDSTDALFVDVIHTDGQAHVQLGLGLIQPIGHVDFYPNGGKEQPKCPRMTGKIWQTILNAFNTEEHQYQITVKSGSEFTQTLGKVTITLNGSLRSISLVFDEYVVKFIECYYH
ncbi:unnamed protein product [Didymodactylos carnosus]|uniref:Lipase domain-containing protein n=1 Tax=Didymodactylos carnosus TaxID=1234261 RepID=A0A813TMG0_9BILA|nr:unnamed protein product [Didymodactylos carnosus]CAF1004340.1 unnamed protein product [Didymodactylos carnosus]CAF3595927.1 unnamed protein product [Didymodactylos carnosus]CAF3773665.1 unnamed protein product [Didymodactylos carnosus]